jgi:hypothetical protein
VPDDELAAGTEHAGHLAGEGSRIREALQQVVRVDRIDGSIRERETLAEVVALEAYARVADRLFPGDGQAGFGGVQPDELHRRIGETGAEREQVLPPPAAEIDDDRALGRLQKGKQPRAMRALVVGAVGHAERERRVEGPG